MSNKHVWLYVSLTGVHPHPPDDCNPYGDLQKDQGPAILTDDGYGQYAERGENEWHDREYESFDVVPHACISAICLKKVSLIFCQFIVVIKYICNYVYMMTLKSRDTEILERAYAINVLLEIDRCPGRSKLEVVTVENTGIRTKMTRISELVNAGLICIEEGDRFNRDLLCLTKKGKAVAKNLKKVRSILLDDCPEGSE